MADLSFINADLFKTYETIKTNVEEIQKANIDIAEQKLKMSALTDQYSPTISNYYSQINEYANEIIKNYNLRDHVIPSRVATGTTYGHQLKKYFWSGITFSKQKSYSFQYSWVFENNYVGIGFCFGAGKGFGGKKKGTNKSKNNNSNSSVLKMNNITQLYIKLLKDPKNQKIISKLLAENFIFTNNWFSSNNDNQLLSLDEYIQHLESKGGAGSGLTLYIPSSDIINGSINLDEKITYYFEIFYPIWQQLHTLEDTPGLEHLDDTPEFEEIEDTEDFEEPPIPAFEPNTDNMYNDDEILPVISHINTYIKQQGFTYPEHLIENFYLSLKSKPFVILAGISGTGKTKLSQKFAEAVGATAENKQFTLIPVRPDWSDPADLIGYKDLSGKFIKGKLTQILELASKTENKSKPYFICLDEMNLARVEHYFSDMLSILETHKWKGNSIVTDTLIEDVENNIKLSIPDNVFIIGTVNMDETTYPFSKKVLDRANTIEFNHIDLSNYHITESLDTITPINVTTSFFRSEYLQLQDSLDEHLSLIDPTVDKLKQINKILTPIHSNIGFRIRDAICFYAIYSSRYKLMKDKDLALDLQINQKILPRIQGSSQAVREALVELLLFTSNSGKNERASLLSGEMEIYKWYVNYMSGINYPNTAEKLVYMIRRFDEDGFTSYWIS